MQKVSQVGEQLKRRSREKEQQLQTEFRESLQRLERNLIELSNSKATQIESDINEKIEEIREFGETKIQRLVNANHKLYKETIESEKREWGGELKRWRRLLLLLLPTALIFGLIVGVLATVLYLQKQPITKKQVNDYLHKKYQVEPTDYGYRLIKKDYMEK